MSRCETERVALKPEPKPPGETGETPADRFGWVEWARALPVDQWNTWRALADSLQAKLPNPVGADALEEGQRLAWIEMTQPVMNA